MTISRDEALRRLRERIDQKIPIVGGGAGTGISAKFEEAVGIDLSSSTTLDAFVWRDAVRSPV